jgi:hypothetical protein
MTAMLMLTWEVWNSKQRSRKEFSMKKDDIRSVQLLQVLWMLLTIIAFTALFFMIDYQAKVAANKKPDLSIELQKS